MEDHQFKKFRARNRRHRVALSEVMKRIALKEKPNDTWAEQEIEVYNTLQQVLRDVATAAPWKSGSRYRWLRAYHQQFVQTVEAMRNLQPYTPTKVESAKETPRVEKPSPAASPTDGAPRFTRQQTHDFLFALLQKRQSGPEEYRSLSDGTLRVTCETLKNDCGTDYDLSTDDRFIKVEGRWTLAAPSLRAVKPAPVTKQPPKSATVVGAPEVEDGPVEVDESICERDPEDNSPDEFDLNDTE